jgi:hypothetical protein
MSGGSRSGYRFGPLERRGLVGALRPAQALVIAAGGLCAVIALDLMPSAGGAILGLLILALTALELKAPLAGRTADEWAPLVASFLSRTARRRRTFRSPAAGDGSLWHGGARRRLDPPAPSPPPALRGVRVVGLDHRGASVGAIADAGGSRLTAVLACRAGSFALLDPEVQERRLARWGMVLASAAGTPIRRLQWIERTSPAQADELARWLHEARDPGIPLRGAPIVESYLELIGSGIEVSREHEILLAVQVDARRGRHGGAAALGETLLEEAQRIVDGLEGAEISVLGALAPEQIARVLRTAFDPYARAELAALEAVDRGRRGLAEVNAWPLGAHERWDRYETDGAVHATYWIAGWPRSEVGPTFMDPLLGASSVTRTVAVSFEPIPPERSTREVEAAITRDRADRELRRRFGQSETARHRQTEEAAARREAELAAGHAEVRLSGFVTISGRDHDELRRGCLAVCDQAARARLELHRLYGQQAEAFTFTLPLARGLR